ncbi:MAG TPA: hypothetical protein VG101_00460 [Puia sp.]|jgi:hypothetical protein|nr:hypothetical protein [Puia sp.]
MKKPLFLLIMLLPFIPSRAQNAPADSLYYVHLQDGTTLYSKKVRLVNSLTRGKYLLLDSNRRISLFSKCYYETETTWWSPAPGEPGIPTTITTREKAWFFRKSPDGDIERITINNLRRAMADNPASLSQLKIAGTNLYVSIGLLAAGAGTAVAGIIQTHQRNTDAYNTYKQQSAAWFANSMTNPNAPLPTLPHYGLSPLFYVGSAMVLSGFIPIFNVRKHLVRALDIYNSAP